jgi:hypothetical protein
MSSIDDLACIRLNLIMAGMNKAIRIPAPAPIPGSDLPYRDYMTVTRTEPQFVNHIYHHLIPINKLAPENGVSLLEEADRLSDVTAARDQLIE